MPFGQRIDGQNPPAGHVLVVGQQLDPRMDHLPAHSLQLRLARDEHPPTLDELLPHPRLIEPEASQILACPANEHAEHRLARPRVPQIDFVDHAHDARQLALFELVDLAQLAHVLIRPRKEEQHIRGVVQIELRQQLRPLRADSLQENCTGVASSSAGDFWGARTWAYSTELRGRWNNRVRISRTTRIRDNGAVRIRFRSSVFHSQGHHDESLLGNCVCLLARLRFLPVGRCRPHPQRGPSWLTWATLSRASRAFARRGIKVEVAAEGATVGQPLAIAFGDKGTILVLQAKTATAAGQLVTLVDSDGDGKFENSELVMSDLAGHTSLLFDDGWYYFAGNGTVARRASAKTGG